MDRTCYCLQIELQKENTDKFVYVLVAIASGYTKKKDRLMLTVLYHWLRKQDGTISQFHKMNNRILPKKQRRKKMRIAKKRTVPNLEARHQTEIQYLHQDRNAKDFGSSPNRNTK